MCAHTFPVWTACVRYLMKSTSSALLDCCIAIPSCLSVLPFPPVYLYCHSLLSICIAIPSCLSVLPFLPVYLYCHSFLSIYTECPRRNVPDFGRVFLMLKYTDITKNTYVQSWMDTEIMAREKCGLLAGPHTVPASWQTYPFRPCVWCHITQFCKR